MPLEIIIRKGRKKTKLHVSQHGTGKPLCGGGNSARGRAFDIDFAAQCTCAACLKILEREAKQQLSPPPASPPLDYQI